MPHPVLPTKAKVYSTPVQSAEHLEARIQTEIRRIPQATLAKVWKNVEFRLNYLRSVGGGHIETSL